MWRRKEKKKEGGEGEKEGRWRRKVEKEGGEGRWRRTDGRTDGQSEGRKEVSFLSEIKGSETEGRVVKEGRKDGKSVMKGRRKAGGERRTERRWRKKVVRERR